MLPRLRRVQGLGFRIQKWSPLPKKSKPMTTETNGFLGVPLLGCFRGSGMAEGAVLSFR